MSMYFEEFDFTDFWDDSDYADKRYVSDPFTEDDIKEVEEKLGYTLPQSYIYLMRMHNGGMPIKTGIRTKHPTSFNSNYIAINGIIGIGKEKSNSLLGEFGSRFWIETWDYPDIGIAICDCPVEVNDMIFLDYRECGPKGEPCVVHVNKESDYEITHLADSFEEFIMSLEDESDMELIVSCPDFGDKGMMYDKNSGYGEDISPEICIEGIDTNAVSMAITLDDLNHPIFPGYNHWVAWNIKPQSRIPANIPKGKVIEKPIHIEQGIAYGKHCYRGPKPPFNWRHMYSFTVYILDIMLDIDCNSKKEDVMNAIKGHVLQTGEIYGIYQRKHD